MHFFGKHWRKRPLAARIAEARRKGVGLCSGEWDGPGLAIRAGVVDWCRESLSRTRRPYGVALFDLTIAVHDCADGIPRSARFHRIDPRDLWSDDSELVRALAQLLPDGRKMAAAVTLFSWGEATHAALSAEAARA